MVAGLYNFRWKEENSEHCNLDYVNYQEALLSETHLYALRRLNNRTLADEIKLGSVFVDICGSFIRSSGSSKILTPQSFCEPDSNRYKNSSIMNHSELASSIAAVTSTGSVQSNMFAKSTQGFCLPTVSIWATSSCFDDTLRYPFFLRTISSDVYSVKAIVELLSEMSWNHVTVIYEHSAYGYYMRWQFEEQVLAFNGLMSTFEPICVETYVDVTMGEWDAVDQRLILNPTYVAVIVVFAGADTVKSMIKHIRTRLFDINGYDVTVSPYKFIITDFDTFTGQDKTDNLDVYMKDTISVLYYSEPMKCNSFVEEVFKRELRNRTNPWVIQALQQEWHCCWTQYPLLKYCDQTKESFTYCNGSESFAYLTTNFTDDVFHSSRRVFDAVHVLSIAVERLMKTYCPGQQKICESFKRSVDGNAILESIIAEMQIGNFSEIIGCNGSSSLFINGTRSAAPSYRISVLRDEWEWIGSYNFSGFDHFPGLKMLNGSSDDVRNRTGTPCRPSCSWYQMSCADSWSMHDGDQSTLTPVFNKCCHQCDMSCYMQVKECLSSACNNSSEACEILNATYCSPKNDYLYQVVCYCPNMRIPTGAEYFETIRYQGYANRAEFSLSNFEYLTMTITTMLLLICLVIVRWLFALWTTPLMRYSAPWITMLHVFLAGLIFCSVFLVSFASRGYVCTLSFCLTSTLYTMSFGSLLVKSILLADSEFLQIGCIRLKHRLNITYRQAEFSLIAIVLLIMLLVHLTVCCVWWQTFLERIDISSNNPKRLGVICLATVSPDFLYLTIEPILYHIATLGASAAALRTPSPFRLYQARFMTAGWLATLCAYCGFYILYVAFNDSNRTNPAIIENSGSTCIGKRTIDWNFTCTSPLFDDARDFMQKSCENGEYNSLLYDNDIDVAPLWHLMTIINGILLLSTTILPILYLGVFEPELNDEAFVLHKSKKSTVGSKGETVKQIIFSVGVEIGGPARRRRARTIDGDYKEHFVLLKILITRSIS